MPDEYISREAALKDFEANNARNPHWTPPRVKTLLLRQPAADVAEVVHEDETTQIIDGCCTACGELMDCIEAAEYKFCPYCAKRVV